MKKSILIFLFALLGILSARAFRFEVNGIYYNRISGTDDQVEVISGNEKYTGSVVIPSTVTYYDDTYHVTSIRNQAFYECIGLTSVTIPEGVTSIGDMAFYACNGLTSVTIPEGVTSIGEMAFCDCIGLTSVTFPESIDTIIGNYVFGRCTSIRTPLYNSKIFAYLPKDYSGEYTIPSGIQSIASGAFEDCIGLTSVPIPESVTSVGNWAFDGCTAISSPLYNSKIFAYMPKNYSGEYAIPSGIQSIAGGAFTSCQGPISVTIPESVTSIGDDVFWCCSGLTSVTIPNSVTYIGESAFAYCYGLTSVTIPEGVTSIGASAFYYCKGLTSVTIPNSVTSIGYAAFECTSIQSPLYSSKMFAYMPQDYNGEYILPSNIQLIAPYAFEGCAGLTSVTIPESVTSIGEEAFYGCSGLTSVTIPKSVSSVGEGAFSHCNNLTSVTSLAQTPPQLYYRSESGYYISVFSDYSATLFVPRGCKAAYRAAEIWRSFITIYEIGLDGTGLVMVHPNDSTMGSVTGGGEYELDEEITIEAIPNVGYHFVRWDDGNTDNPRTLTVAYDITLTAIFAQGDPTANENAGADNLRVYVQDRTICLSEDQGAVQVYNMAGQRIYNGHATAIPVRQSGVYVLAVGQQRIKVLVR